MLLQALLSTLVNNHSLIIHIVHSPSKNIGFSMILYFAIQSNSLAS